MNREGKLIPMTNKFLALKNRKGILVSAAIRDITSQKIAERKILEQRKGRKFQRISG